MDEIEKRLAETVNDGLRLLIDSRGMQCHIVIGVFNETTNDMKLIVNADPSVTAKMIQEIIERDDEVALQYLVNQWQDLNDGDRVEAVEAEVIKEPKET